MPPFVGQRGNAKDENSGDDVLQTANYGGLNTISNRLNIPLEDSPDMQNVRVNEMGNVTKRQGSNVVGTVTGLTNVSGVTMIPVTLRIGYKALLAKEGTNLKLYLVENNTLTAALITKSNVFSSRAASLKCDYIVTSETEPRIIMTTGYNTPVQATFVEHTGTASGAGSYVFSDTRFATISTSNIIYWRNGVRVSSGFSVGYAGGNVTITHASIANNDIIEVVFITWQWWAEALKLEGDQLFYTTTRFHVSQPDQLIPISSRLTMNILPITFGDYPIRLQYSTAYGQIWTRATNRIPATVDEWAFSGGGVWDIAVGGEILPGTQYVCFGGIRPYVGAVPAAPSTVIALRGYKLGFRGQNGQSGNKLIVRVDDTTYTQNINNAAGSGTPAASPTYYLRDSAYAILTSTSTVATFITFDATTVIGNSAASFVEVINAEVNTSYIGSGALSEYTEFKDGCLVPAYGLGEVADYFRGSFPRTVKMYQGRLVFGGFPTAPMTVLMSNVYDSTKVGQFWTNYQTQYERGLATDPIDVLITNTLDDFITGMVEFQNNLFVFTRQSIHRVHGGQTGLVTISNTFLNFVAAIGAVNPQSIVRVDKTVMYLATSGVYDILPTVEAGDFTAGEKSLKIRNLLNTQVAPYNEATAWMMYDPIHNDVYCSVGETTTSYATSLYIFSTVREAWTKYAMTGGVFTTVSGCVIRATTSSNVLIAHARSTTEIEYLSLWNSRYIDQYQTFTTVGTGSFGIVTNYPYREATHTTKTWQTVYGTTISSGQARGFTLSDVVSIQDCKVFLNSVELVFGTEWVKTHKSEIMLLIATGDGDALVIEYRCLDGTHPIVVYRDNIKLVQVTDYTVTKDGSTNSYKINFTSGINNAIIGYGSMYPVHHKSPFFIRGNMHILKQMTHYVGYFDNLIGQEHYKSTDANAASSQDYAYLVETPKNRLDYSLVFLYEELDEGFSDYNVYSYTDLYWDYSVFDVAESHKQSKRYSRFVEPMVGVSYGFQVILYLLAETAFEMIGYQIRTVPGKRNAIGVYD